MEEEEEVKSLPDTVDEDVEEMKEEVKEKEADEEPEAQKARKLKRVANGKAKVMYPNIPKKERDLPK